MTKVLVPDEAELREMQDLDGQLAGLEGVVEPKQAELQMGEREEEDALKRISSPDLASVGDLSDGGMVGEALLFPMKDGKRVLHARPAAIRAWMWNGTESLLPLAWNPEGTEHDWGRRYLRKRHCLCCNTGGFIRRQGHKLQCPNCVKSTCNNCKASTDPKKIIRSFYLRQEDVPFKDKFYGPINCFLPTCPRRDGRGFKTEQEMRMHARSRHRLEYQALVESQSASSNQELGELRQRLNDLTAQLMRGEQNNGKRQMSEKARQAARERMIKMHEKRREAAVLAAKE